MYAYLINTSMWMPVNQDTQPGQSGHAPQAAMKLPVYAVYTIKIDSFRTQWGDNSPGIVYETTHHSCCLLANPEGGQRNEKDLWPKLGCTWIL